MSTYLTKEEKHLLREAIEKDGERLKRGERRIFTEVWRGVVDHTQPEKSEKTSTPSE